MFGMFISFPLMRSTRYLEDDLKPKKHDYNLLFRPSKLQPRISACIANVLWLYIGDGLP